MAFYSTKDFVTNVAIKVKGVFLPNTEFIQSSTLYDSTGAEIFGPRTDAANTSTDSTPVSFFSLIKQCSSSLQAIASVFSGGLNPNGRVAAANSAPMVLSTEDYNGLTGDQYSQYETVAASSTAQALGATGATGDYLAGVLVFPSTAACGVVTILDNATTIGTFAGGGTTALPSLVPFMIPIGLVSVSGAWKITTGAGVACVGIGKFT